jgi:peptide/nickel transport system substrate-binding protein
MSRSRSAISLLALVLAAGGCGKDAPPASARPGGAHHPNELRSATTWVQDVAPPPAGLEPSGSLVLALLGEPDSFNPYLSTTGDVDELLRFVFPQLMVEDPDFASKPPTFTPYLAERWETSDDGKTITFHLRKDMTWSDGVPITAEDVRFSWQAARDKDVAWVNHSIKDFIDDVKVIDEKTVALHYSERSAYQLMDANDGYIIPKHVFGKLPFKEWKTHPSWTKEAGVAGGPYRITGYTAQESVTLEANPTYYRKGHPKIPKVTFRIIKNQTAMRDAFLSGGIHVLPSVVPQDAKRILDHGEFRLFNCLGRFYSYVGYNCARFPFDQPAVRKALTLATDREDLVESIYLGYAVQGYSPIIKSLWAHDRTLAPWPQDPDAAAKLMEGAGWKRGADGFWQKDGKRLAFTIMTHSANQVRVRACTRLQSDWKEFGADVKIETPEFNQMIERLRKHDVEAWFGVWQVATKVDEKGIWHSESRGYDGGNHANYSNPRVDQIIDQARIMTDLEASKPLWSEFQRIVHEEQPYTFIAEQVLLNAVVKRVRNVKSAAATTYYNIDEWWLETTAR